MSSNGQARIGIRSAIPNSPIIPTTTISASLLQSLYGAWNGDTTTNELSTSLYGVWNGEYSGTASLETSLYGVWNGDALGTSLPSSNDSFGTNHGTLMNGTTFTTGKIGNAFSFDGVNDYVSLPNTSFRQTGDFSISAWINPSVQGSYNMIFEDYINISGNQYGVALYIQGSKLRFATYNVTGNLAYGNTSTISNNTWQHIVITKTAGNAWKMYINNTLQSLINVVGNISTNPAYNASNVANIGSDIDTGTRGGYFNGKIDALSVWTKELTANEVSMLYNGSNGTQYSSGSFGLTQSSLDSFGTYHGTLVNTTYGTGKIGSAFNFNGSNTYVSMGTGAGNFGSNSFSISGWFYPNVGNVLQMLVAKGTTTATNKGFAVAIDNRYNSNQRALTFGLVGNNSNYQNLTTTTTNQYTIGNWNHFTVVWDSTNKSMKIYLNGVQATTTTTLINGTGASGISDISNTSAELLFGQYGDNTSKFNGKLDSVTMWDRIVSVDEVTQLYNSGTGAQYPFTGTFSSAINQLGVDNGTLMNGCYLSDGKIGQAFTFDGINDFVLLPTNSMRFTGDFSYSFFVSLGNTSGTQTVFSCENYLSNENGDRGYIINFTNGLLKFLGYYNSTVIINSSSTTTVTANTWNHFVVTKTSSQVKIYMNGVLQTTTNYTGIIAYNSVVYPSIGVTYKQNNVNNNNYSYISAGSKIDALTAYQKELTQSEITELYNSGNGKQITTTPIVQSGLVLNLDASRTSSYPNTGTTWTDISGNGYNGTMTNGPIFGTASGGAITFDGVNDYVDTGLQYSLTSSTNFTIGIWFKGFGRSSSNDILVLNYSGTPVGWAIYQSNTGKFMCFSRDNNNVETSYINSITSTNTNQWFYGVYKKSGNQFSLYINGVLEATTNANLGNISISNGMRIANHTVISQPYLGSIGSVKVYNKSLTDSEVLQNFNATKKRFGL